MWFKRKRKNIALLRISKEEWTQSNSEEAYGFLNTRTFKLLVSVLHGYLIHSILNGASDDYRRGYLDAIRQLSSFSTKQQPDEKEDEYEHFYE